MDPINSTIYTILKYFGFAILSSSSFQQRQCYQYIHNHRQPQFFKLSTTLTSIPHFLLFHYLHHPYIECILKSMNQWVKIIIKLLKIIFVFGYHLRKRRCKKQYSIGFFSLSALESVVVAVLANGKKVSTEAILDKWVDECKFEKELLKSIACDSNVDAHGTPTGDPIETEAIPFKERDKSTPLLIGSFKGKIGHCEASSGVVSVRLFIKLINEKSQERYGMRRIHGIDTSAGSN
ncbi:hypothetical protein ACTA71_000976 [Dictyostelium dimigraforme]